MKVIDIIAIVLLFVGTGAFIYLMPQFKTLLPQIETWLLTHTTAEQRQAIVALADLVVDAAEQIFGAKTGEQKKEYAMKLFEKLMPHVDESVRDAAIEGSVYRMNAADQEK